MHRLSIKRLLRKYPNLSQPTEHFVKVVRKAQEILNRRLMNCHLGMNIYKNNTNKLANKNKILIITWIRFSKFLLI
jgi:hypothetical protein